MGTGRRAINLLFNNTVSRNFDNNKYDHANVYFYNHKTFVNK